MHLSKLIDVAEASHEQFELALHFISGLLEEGETGNEFLGATLHLNEVAETVEIARQVPGLFSGVQLLLVQGKGHK